MKSTFSFKEDLDNVKLGEAYDNAVKGSALADKKEPLFRAALEDLEKGGVVFCLDSINRVYVLTQPLTSLPQNVIVSSLTAHRLAELINGFGQRTGFFSNPHQYATNKFAITDGDIAAAIQICHALANEVDELVEMLDDGPPDDELPPQADGGGYNKLTHPFDPDAN